MRSTIINVTKYFLYFVIGLTNIFEFITLGTCYKTITNVFVSVVPVGVPQVSVNKSGLENGRALIADCHAPSSYPACNITFFVNDEKVNLINKNILYRCLSIGSVAQKEKLIILI